MRLRILLILSLLAVLPAAFAESADEYFHGGAQSYISNNIPKAREFVDGGLKLYPEDIKLKKLDELLKQQSQSQQSQSQQSQSSQDQQQQQQQKDKSQPDQNKNSQSQPQENKQENKPEQGSGEQHQAKAQETPGQMTPQQAKQLLDSQKNGEMLLPYSRKDKQRNRPQTVLKDW